MTILVGYDGRREGRDALALGGALATALAEPVLVASVYPSADVGVAVPVDEVRAGAERTAADGAAELPDGVDASSIAVPGRSAAEGLYRVIEAEQPTLVVVGSSHRGPLRNVLAGHVASRLLTASPCPVAIAPRGVAMGDPPAIKHIGVGFDDSPESWNAVQRAAALGVAAGATLRVIHALQPVVAPPMTPLESERLTRKLRVAREQALFRARESVSKELHAETTLLVGDPVRVLDEEAARDLDLLVLGSRGYGPVRRVLLGGVSESVVRRAPCAVVVVPRSVAFDPNAAGMAGADVTAGEPARAAPPEAR
jgi:nucleotide-binding universal stress UspA family protein